MLSYYLTFWPALASVVVLASCGMTSLVNRRLSWLTITVVCVALALLLYAPGLLATAASRRHNVLQRDIVASLLFVGATPLLVSRLIAALKRRGVSPPSRAFAGLALGLVCVLVTPWAVMFVHCTSGDCL